MLYLLALILPPLAILFCSRPISALLNLAWLFLGLAAVYVFNVFGLIAIPFAFIGAVLHAILVVSKTSADERQRELITALGGKLPPRKNWELDFAALLIGGILIVAAGAMILNPQRGVIKIQNSFSKTAPPQTAPAAPPAQPAQPAQPAPSVSPLPSIEGWNLQEVVSIHGEPQTKDRDSGWASWSTFRARFEAGTVVEVSHP